ncbi:MAG: hydroxymethylbilane synthase [Myxococcota bacterium]
MTPVRIATRGSDLALAQTRHMADRVARALDVRTELVIVQTSGDRLRDVPLSAIGGKGLFVKEIEEALLGGHADMAVHSAKDLPARTPDGLALAAFPEREDARDALVGREQGARLDGLAEGARVGTGSARRGALVRAARPDLTVVPLRGNVPTRLQKIEDEGLDAVILACAGLDRLGLSGRIHERIDPGRMLPAVGQGTLALETRADDPLRERLASQLDDADAARAAAAERAFLERLEGDCNIPLAAHAERAARGGWRIRGLVSTPDGARVVRDEEEVAGDPDASVLATAGARLADRVLAAGGRAILDALRAEGDGP